MKIIVLNNTAFNVDFTDTIAYFKKHGVDIEFSSKPSKTKVSVIPYKSVQGFNPKTGKPEVIKYYGIKNPVSAVSGYDITMFMWDIDTVETPTDGAITSWSITNVIQLAINKYLIDKGQVTKRISHEIMHALSYMAHVAGFPNTDEMDITKSGLPFYKNDDPNAPDGNYALTFKNLEPYLKPNSNHLEIALAEYGVTEIVGGKHNPRIVQYFSEIGDTWVKDDETAWCSAFANWVTLKANLPRSKKLNARSWLDVGKAVTSPKIGDIVVFWAESKTSWQGHVAFFISDSGDYLNVLGGNQSNSVCISKYPKYKVLGYRRLST